MAVVRSLLFALLFYPGTLVYVLAAFAVAPFGAQRIRAIVHAWADYHFWLVRHVLGIRVEWDGEIPRGPFLVAAKHHSMMEAIDSIRFARTPLIVLKRELTMIPLFGPVTRMYGVIGVDRDAGASALRDMMTRAKAVAAERRPVIIFPEGTRVRFGEAPALRPGFAGLYRALGLPVVPVAHDSGKLWPRGFIKRPGTIRFKVGEAIPPGLKRDEIEARVHAAINALTPEPPSVAQGLRSNH